MWAELFVSTRVVNDVQTSTALTTDASFLNHFVGPITKTIWKTLFTAKRLSAKSTPQRRKSRAATSTLNLRLGSLKTGMYAKSNFWKSSLTSTSCEGVTTAGKGTMKEGKRFKSSPLVTASLANFHTLSAGFVYAMWSRLLLFCLFILVLWASECVTTTTV